MISKLGWAAIGLVALLAPAVAAADEPAPAVPATPLPSYARPSVVSDEETVRGRISATPDKYHLELRDDRGFIDKIEMHQGTIINPTGLKLSTGMSATVHGYNRGATFAANEIDTPYRESPSYAYGAPPYPFAGYTPYYGYAPYNGYTPFYGYGPVPYIGPYYIPRPAYVPARPPHYRRR